MDLIDFLLQAGADVNLKDVDGDTPILLAESPYVFERLIEAGGIAILSRIGRLLLIYLP